MSRQSRREQRILNDQNTVGMQRAEREEQQELAGMKKIKTKAQRSMKLQQKENAQSEPPRRIARVGKPLKRRT